MPVDSTAAVSTRNGKLRFDRSMREMLSDGDLAGNECEFFRGEVRLLLILQIGLHERQQFFQSRALLFGHSFRGARANTFGASRDLLPHRFGLRQWFDELASPVAGTGL